MSSSVRKYRIKYDGNDGHTYTKYVYCKYEHVCDCQLWCYEDGDSVNFDCVTDSQAEVIACCVADITMSSKYFYWEEVNEFDIPELVAEKFNYKYPQHIVN